MALRSCKECKQMISSDAKVCPHCGKKVGMGAGAGCLIVLGVLIGLGIIGSLTSSRSGRSGSSSSSPGTSGTSSEATPDSSLRWNYEQSPDSMGRGTIKRATVRSLNEIEFGFPYQGSQRGTLQLRIHPKYGKDAILIIERGQFLCHIDGCVVSVRFDQGKAQTYSAAEAADGSTTALFISNYDRFLAGLRKSNKVYIEAQFYQEASRVFEFDTDGLKW